MNEENFQYDGLLGITFIDIDGNATPAKQAVLNKAKSFSGNRSEAGRYAAQVRWGNRGDSTKYGLKTDRPVIVYGDEKQVLIVQENGAYRTPSAQERGIVTAKEFKDSISEELAVLGKDDRSIPKQVTPALRQITQFHEMTGSDGTWIQPTRNARGTIETQGAIGKVSAIKRMADRLEWEGGASNQAAMQIDSAKAKARSVIAQKLVALADLMMTLKKPFTIE